MQASRSKIILANPEDSCNAVGVICDGYTGSNILIHQFSEGQPQPLIVKEPGDSPAPGVVKVNPRDMRLFDLLRTETVRQLTGPFDQGFWTIDVPQAMRQYPAMWYACLTLATTQKQTATASNSERHVLHLFSMQYYGCAVRSVIDIVHKPASRISNTEREAVMLAAIIFSSISSLKGDTHEARVHAMHCIQLFQCWRSLGAAASSKSRRTVSDGGCVLQPVVMAAIVTHFECQFPNRPDTAESTLYRCGMQPLMSVGEAYFEFMQLLCGLNHTAYWAKHGNDLSHHPPAGPAPDTLWHSRTQFRAWRRRFDRLRVMNFDKKADQQGIRVLELLFTGIDPVLAMDSADAVCGWDEHHARIWDLYRRSSAILREEDIRQGAEKDQRWDSGRFIMSVSPCPS